MTKRRITPCVVLPPEIKVHYIANDGVEKMRSDYSDKAYYNLKEEMTFNGFCQSLELQSYNITPESVKSYADSVNYKQDLAGNICAKGTNLGDITGVSDMLSKDSETVKELYCNISKLTEAVKGLQVQQQNKDVKEETKVEQ